jgi:hypothetical protein
MLFLGEARPGGIAAVGDATERIFDGQCVEGSGIVVVRPFFDVGVARVGRISDRFEQFVEAQDAATVLGRSVSSTADTARIVAWVLSRVRSSRLARTLEQATKIIEFVERWSAGYDGLTKLPEANRNGAENLMLDAMQAVREDLAAERAVLPEFGKTTFSVRSALLPLPSPPSNHLAPILPISYADLHALHSCHKNSPRTMGNG